MWATYFHYADPFPFAILNLPFFWTFRFKNQSCRTVGGVLIEQVIRLEYTYRITSVSSVPTPTYPLQLCS